MWDLAVALIGLFIGFVVVYLVMITLEAVIEWFHQRSELVESDSNHLAFTIQEKLNDGDYVVYQGVFNRASQELLCGQKMQSSCIDDELEALHAEQPLAIYQ